MSPKRRKRSKGASLLPQTQPQGADGPPAEADALHPAEASTPWDNAHRQPPDLHATSADNADFQFAPSIPATLDVIIADLTDKQGQLSAYIDAHPELDVRDMVSLFATLGQNASRLGRLLRDKRAISGEAADGIAGAIAQALDELGTELGIEL